MRKRLFLIVLLTLIVIGSANAKPPFIVRTIYFQPIGTKSIPPSEIAVIMEYAQELYASEMELQGFGRKTFTLERNRAGDVVVHRVNGRKTARNYHNSTFDAVTQEMPNRFNPNTAPWSKQDEIRVILVGGLGRIDNNTNYGVMASFSGIRYGGTSVIAANTDDYGAKVGDVVAHEVGHCFGLSHKPKGTDPDPPSLEHYEARWLDTSYHFNDFTNDYTFPNYDKNKIELSATHDDTVVFKLPVSHANGLHQSMITRNGVVANWDYLNGETSDVVRFEMPREEWAQKMELFLMDVKGNYHYYGVSLSIPEALPPIIVDINADGVVNIQDLVLVAARLGEMWDGKEDVNRDGVVNILDLVLVANAF